MGFIRSFIHYTQCAAHKTYIQITMDIWWKQWDNTYASLLGRFCEVMKQSVRRQLGNIIILRRSLLSDRSMRSGVSYGLSYREDWVDLITRSYAWNTPEKQHGAALEYRILYRRRNPGQPYTTWRVIESINRTWNDVYFEATDGDIWTARCSWELGVTLIFLKLLDKFQSIFKTVAKRWVFVFGSTRETKVWRRGTCRPITTIPGFLITYKRALLECHEF